jgi:DNA-directed RNA polymerase specialized sigma24 family protein
VRATSAFFPFRFSAPALICDVFPYRGTEAVAEGEFEMIGEAAAAPKRRRISAHGSVLRRRWIFARLREGFSYEEIANEEGVTGERIRQIVSEVLRKRSVDSGADHGSCNWTASLR